jgi:hypothetical protein
MSEKPSNRTELIAEAFHENWNDGHLADLALRAAAHARQRRRMRHGFQIGSAITCVAAILLMLNSTHQLQPVQPTLRQITPVPAYEIISDEELFAELKDHALLAVKNENGARELVLLDH